MTAQRIAMETPGRPLYRVVARALEERIARHEYKPGASLPAEPALGQEFGVSRITVRQALALLKRQGLLYSKSGVGTLVRSDPSPPGRMRMTGSLVDLVNYGAETNYTPIDRVLIRPSPAIAKILGGFPADRWFRFRGLRSRSGEPAFGFEEVYISEHLGQRIDNATLGGRTLFSLLEEINGIQIVDAQQVITAVLAPADVSRYLRIHTRSPVLRVTRNYQIAGGRTVELAFSHYVPSRFEYVMTLYRE
jgi:GntR family transcriptional regulator